MTRSRGKQYLSIKRLGMAINEKLTKLLREALVNIPNVEEKRMFSGIAFMVNGKMCISAGNDRLMCRVNPILHEEIVQLPGVTTVVMRGREYKGYVYVDEKSVASKKQLDYWVKLCLDFNKEAKASRKKK